MESVLRSFPTDRLTDLMRELSKLGFQVASFLDIKIGSIVDRVDDNLFASFSGEENKREVAKLLSDLL